MRTFYMEDQKGERIALNNETGIFLYHPSGLGIAYGHSYGESGTGFFLRQKDGIEQLEIGGSLIFTGGEKTPYERYREFIDWIYAAEELYFVYCPYSPNEYYRRVDVQTIEKSELNQYGMLECGISLLPMTPWYLPSPIYINFGDDQEDAMRYSFWYTDDLIYGIGSNDYTAEITARGHIPSAVKVTFKGEAINPVLTLRGSATRKVYGVCSISESFQESDTLVFSSAEQDSYVKKIDASGNETDLLDKIDITTNPFFRVPLSEPCELTISGDTIYGDASMMLYVYYRGV